jgi:hypothetical protein
MQDSEQSARYRDKLTRELGQTVMTCLADSATEDIVLNPDSSLWARRTRDRFSQIGNMKPWQPQSAFSAGCFFVLLTMR